MMMSGRDFWLTLVLVVAVGTAIAFAAGIRDSWPFILPFGVLGVGVLAFVALGLLSLWSRRR